MKCPITMFSSKRNIWTLLTIYLCIFLVIVNIEYTYADDDELDPNDFTKMDIDVRAAVDFHAAYPAVVKSGHSRNAYVFIHYEGTPKDDMYVLGVRVVVQSIKESGTKQDIVVICALNCRPSTVKLFEDAGVIVKNVPNIPNPYKATQQRRRTYKSRFEFTFNKLYVWNLLEYERVMYLDADNLVTRNIDELFLCGHYCVTFFNPLFFHTGMMIVKPNAEKFKSLVYNLLSLASFSYDGADQGFLTAEFANVDNAPLFNAKQQLALGANPSEAPVMRFNMEYNMNSVYFYPYYSWDFYRRVNLPFSQEGDDVNNLPLGSIDYCIGPLLKPWNWLPFIFFTTVRYWDAIRMRINESHTSDRMDMVILLTIVITIPLIIALILKRWAHIDVLRRIFRSALRTVGSKPIAWLLGLSSFATAIGIVALFIPQQVPPVYAWPTIYLVILFVFYHYANIFSICVAPTLSNVKMKSLNPSSTDGLSVLTQYNGSGPSFGEDFSEISALILNTDWFEVYSARNPISNVDDIGVEPIDCDMNQEAHKGYNLVMTVDEDRNTTVEDEFEDEIINNVPKVSSNLSLSISHALLLRNGMNLSVIYLPLAILVLFIYLMCFAGWHFHFVEKIFLLTFCIIGYVASYIYTFDRIAKLSLGTEGSMGKIQL